MYYFEEEVLINRIMILEGNGCDVCLRVEDVRL